MMNSKAEDPIEIIKDALVDGDFSTVEEMIRSGIDVNSRDSVGRSILRATTTYCGEEAVRFLLNLGADVHARDEDGMTALYDANPNVVELLVEFGADINTRVHQGMTPLHHVAQYDCDVLMQALLMSGADVNACNDECRTPLHEAARFRKDSNVVALLEAGADPLARDQNGDTPFDVAQCRDHDEQDRCLIFLSEAMFKVDGNKGTSLMNAVAEGKVVSADSLIDVGADVNFCDEMGQSMMHFAVGCGENSRKMVKMVASNGASLDVISLDFITPLCIVVYRGDTELAELLIDLGADWQLGGWSRSRSPLHIAAEQGDVPMATMLLQRGADLFAMDEDGYTPLELAQSCGKQEMVDFLQDIK